ncbi:hypothetical protein GCM10023084_82280 [Streptomyces lacrimifluminis]|uniref:NUDIX hydrolase n=1 Tax=Streptomyces lacrimifluminis TaxID=1500077 RepID=A0A917PDU6_9ACTN|nr:hypothetical protein [Streptomyces lacrimifluminis]GGJ71948.1 hypothetical protein GCM10012282_81040 [Streptomyces lacrimifluminis]
MATHIEEETGGKVRADKLVLIGTYDAPGCDPRGPVSTDAYLTRVPASTEDVVLDDATAVRWVAPADALRKQHRQKALADSNELPPRPKAGTGAKAVKAGFGPHGVAVTDTILAYSIHVPRRRL